jgi:four helix bundle protein
MSRNHNKLEAFRIADELALLVYRETQVIAYRDEDIRRQLRRAAISIPANIVEGCARQSRADYARFLDIALGSAAEADYLLDLCARLDLLPAVAAERCKSFSQRCVAVLQNLHDAVRRLP